MKKNDVVIEETVKVRKKRRRIRRFLRRKNKDPRRAMLEYRSKTVDFSLIENKTSINSKISLFMFLVSSSLIFFIFFSMFGFISSATIQNQ